MKVHIYYDGGCPFCSHYVALLRLRDTVGEPKLFDLRESTEAREQIRGRSYDIDQGMVVEIDDQWYHGSDAIHVLSVLSTSSGFFNRISRTVFSSRLLASVLYPLLRAGRNISLFALGRKRLESAFEIQPPWLLFNSMLGLFAVAHVLVYSFKFKPPGYPSTWLLGVLGFSLIVKPGSLRLATALLVTLAVDGLLQMPMYSNHTVLKNFLLLGMAFCAIRQLWRGGSWSDFYTDFAPVGRTLLLTMYVFGVFHKINTGFLDPEVSCAVALWHAMPAPFRYIDFTLWRYLSIYGTLVIESAILLSLLAHRTRTVGIGIGIAFHAMLALSSYGMYVAFSTLTVALHVLFLEGESASRITTSQPWIRFYAGLQTVRGVALLLAWISGMALLAWNLNYSQVGVLWLPAILFVAWMVVMHGKDGSRAPASIIQLLWSRSFFANVISALFILNCVAPYLGLKTAQSMNMFSNLRLESGVSNHLVFQRAPGPFDYLEDTVEIIDSGHSAYLGHVQRNSLRVVYYDLLDKLDRDPALRVGFFRNGKEYVAKDIFTLSADAEDHLHPRWFRNWFHFHPADIEEPILCFPNG